MLDPTAGSGGFLLESLLQVWHRIDDAFAGQPPEHIQRIKYDFAKTQVYGIEVHEILARICKINLLLHHDGHTNIEGKRSALDSVFVNPRLTPPSGRFSIIVGNPPFGTEVAEGDDEQLGQNNLDAFTVAEGMRKIDSEQVIIERCIELLEPGGKFGLILPDGLLNNQGDKSNCPRMREFMATHGRILAIVSLPDHAFRKSGAQNKTSIIFFEKYARADKRRLDRELARVPADDSYAMATATVAARLDYHDFMGEANQVGYTPAGASTPANDLYRSGGNGVLGADQTHTILGEWQKFKVDPADYTNAHRPDCAAVLFSDLWRAHSSHRLDPKYHLFNLEAAESIPDGWVRAKLGEVLERRADEADFTSDPDRLFQVMTISQTGEIRPREAGKGRNLPEWRASYFDESPGSWFAAKTGDVVFSSIDLWKGCIAFVPDPFDGAVVTKEFPIYKVSDRRLSPEFLQVLLRSRYYQRAFRAITTGHSNRRRTQVPDFEALPIAFPPARQAQQAARTAQRAAGDTLRAAVNGFSDVIDGRGDEKLPEVEAEPIGDDE